MITEFFVYSRDMVERIVPHEVPHIIVSIQTPGDPKEARLPTNEHTLAAVRLEFHDLCDDALQHADVADRFETQCFNHDHARAILGAVRAHPSAKRLVVHCDAGMSRSPAVAAALSKILLGDDSYFFKRYMPNSRVYRTILEEHFAPEA